MDIKTWDITGFGGGYEATCQQMLWNAVRFLTGQGRDVKTFDVAMMDGIEDATGAMHHCATNHALYIAKNGYEKWFAELGDARTKDGEKEYIFKYPIEFELKGDPT